MSEDPRQRLAYDRTHLANERTFAAWIRTGLTVSAAGFGVTHLSSELKVAPAASLWLGMLFGLAGIGFILFGAWRFSRVSRDLSRAGSPNTPVTLSAIFILAALLSVLLVLVVLIPIF